MLRGIKNEIGSSFCFETKQTILFYNICVFVFRKNKETIFTKYPCKRLCWQVFKFWYEMCSCCCLFIWNFPLFNFLSDATNHSYEFVWMRRASFANCSEHSALEKNYGKKMKYVGSNVNIATDGKGGMVWTFFFAHHSSSAICLCS